LRLAPLRLRDLMDELQDRWQARAAQGGTTLLISYDGDPDACVLADRSRLVQVFDGFIGEAMASVRKGAVEASLRAVRAGDALRLEGRVRSGRDPARTGRTLEARVREVDARFGLDVAMGVMLARSIVAGLNGELRTEANAGAGETLTFSLTAQPAAEAASAPGETPGRSAHILVVDDNATNRMVASALVEMFDCTCETAEDGLQAVELARTGRYDLILMDIKMPQMDGVSAARAIRALPGRPGLAPIVALTANADPDDVAAYLAAGMNGVVEKPMKPEHLLQALRQALDDTEDVVAA
ncbi:MAG: response regulator, partial [Phenylobacterium sp.]